MSISSSNALAEPIEIRETDTSPVKTMRIIHSAHPWKSPVEAQRQTDEIVTQECVFSIGSCQGFEDFGVNDYCEDKFENLSENEL